MAPAPAGVEVMPVAPVILDGDKPPSQPIHQPSSWILDGNSLEPRDMDEETPNDRMSRMSRMSTSSQFASEEDIALELQETIKQDTKAGVERPANYIPLGSRLPFRVPRVPDDLSPKWLTAAFHFKKLMPPDISVVQCEWKAIGEGGGVMGVIVIVTLTYSANAPDSLPKRMVAKFSPQGKAPLPRFMIRAIFKAEAHFYNDFSIKQGGLTRPECYLALYDAKKSKPTFCMLLEDMMPAVSFTRVSSCDDADHLNSAVAALARMHAKWWQHPKTKPLDWLLHPSKDFGGILLNGFVRVTKVGLAALSKCYGQTYAPILKWLPVLRRRHKYILRELFRPPLTMCHGDAHIENAFFDGRFPGGCAFIDFGNMMFSQPMYDVAFFMVHSLDVDTRRKHERAVVEHYHATLLANGVDPDTYSLERCWKDYRFNFWRAFISLLAMGPSVEHQHRTGTGIFAEHPTKADQQMREMYEKLNERIVAALLDHDWLAMAQEQSMNCGLCSCIPFCF